MNRLDIDNIIEGDSFKKLIKEAIENAKYIDWSWNETAQDETSFEEIDIDEATDNIIEIIKQQLL